MGRDILDLLWKTHQTERSIQFDTDDNEYNESEQQQQQSYV